jgi:hypothetical protein
MANPAASGDTAPRPRGHALALAGHRVVTRQHAPNELRVARTVIDDAASDNTTADDSSDADTIAPGGPGRPLTSAAEAALAAAPDDTGPWAPLNLPSLPDREVARGLPLATRDTAADKTSTIPIAMPVAEQTHPSAAVSDAGPGGGAMTALSAAQAMPSLSHRIEPARAVGALGAPLRSAIVFVLIFVALAGLALLGAQLADDRGTDDPSTQPPARSDQEQTAAPDR